MLFPLLLYYKNSFIILLPVLLAAVGILWAESKNNIPRIHTARLKVRNSLEIVSSFLFSFSPMTQWPVLLEFGGVSCWEKETNHQARQTKWNIWMEYNNGFYCILLSSILTFSFLRLTGSWRMKCNRVLEREYIFLTIS